MHKAYKPFSIGGGQDLFRAFLRTITILKSISLEEVQYRAGVFFSFQFLLPSRSVTRSLALGNLQGITSSKI